MTKLKIALKKVDKYYFLILIISLFLLLPLLNNLYFYGHDTGYHLANIKAIGEILNFKSLFNLKILPIIAHNFGYGSGIFYPKLSHLLGAVIYKTFNIPIFTSLKITNFIIIYLSGIFMYKFMKTITKNKNLSIVATLFYLTAPYKIYDYLYRDALAESFIFIFIPIIFLGVYYIINGDYKKFYFYFVIGYVGIINSHLVMTLFITLFLIIILLINIKKILSKENIKHFLIATIIVLLICLPFIIPLIYHKLNGNYVVFQNGMMANKYGVYWNGLYIYQFLIGWKSSKIGLHFFNHIAFILIIYLIVKLIKQKKLKQTLQNNYLFSIGFVCTFLGILMSSHIFPWTIMPSFFLMIQFPWRLGTLTCFGISILSYFALKEINSKKVIILSTISCFIFATICMFIQDYHEYDLNYYDLSTLGMGWQEEYLPMNTKQNIDYFNNRNNDILVINGEAKILLIENKTPYLKFKITNVSNAKLELPRLYYLGYSLKVTDEFNNITNLNYRENQKGFIEIDAVEDGTYELIYTGTQSAKIANVISLFTLIGFIIYKLRKDGKTYERYN